MKIRPVTLQGDHVRLEPLTPGHHAALCEVCLDENLWRRMPRRVRDPEQMREYIASALREQEQGLSLPFATVEVASGRVVGSTRFMNIAMPHRRVEIGSTFIARPWQRTAVNTEAKYLMLGHAFEALGCLRVELKTDSLNERSRAAILRLGATEEGTFRNHMVLDDGRVRHTVYYSIIDSEWPDVRARLRAKLGRDPA
jgi:N-acetyltransferase